MAYGDFALMDYSEATAGFRVHFGAITAISLPGFLSQFGALRNALDNITLGTIVKERWVGDETIVDNFPPTNPMAQRELKWMVELEEAGGGDKWHLTIACPDLSLTKKVPPHVQIADTTKPEIQAFITALEALVVNPKTGWPGIIYGMEIVGRKL